MNSPTRTAPATKATTPRVWALGSAAALATVTAVLHTFVQASPTIDALMAGDAALEAQQGLRMMWHGMSAIAWACPLVLLLLARRPAVVTRPALAFVAILNGTQALFYVATGIGADGVAGLLTLPQWTLHAAVAVLAWLARPAGKADGPRPGRRPPLRLVLLVIALSIGVFQAVLHTAVATFDSWPSALLASDTAYPEKPALYAMWLFSCVIFISVPVALVWSLRVPAAAGRFVVRCNAVLIGCLFVAWTTAVVLGFGSELSPTGPFALGIQATLIALSVPPRPDPAP